MGEYSDSEKRFRADTAKHEMTVLHDDGLYRHLRFKDPKNGFYWFDLVTWPGHLSFTGDMDGYAFSRVEDMFAFFRQRPGNHGINPQYWAEKVVSGRESLKVYGEDLFKQQVAEDLKTAEEDYPGVTEAWNEKVTGVYAEYHTSTEHDARNALNDFEYLPEDAARRGASSAADTITLAAHGLADGEPIVFTNAGTATNIIEGRTYYVVSSTWNTFKVATGSRGSALTLGTASYLSWTGVPFRFEGAWEWNLQDFNWSFLWCCHAIVWGIAQYDASKRAKVREVAVSES